MTVGLRKPGSRHESPSPTNVKHPPPAPPPVADTNARYSPTVTSYRPIARPPPDSTTISGHSSQSRKTSPERRGASTAAPPNDAPPAPDAREPEAGELTPPTGRPTAAGGAFVPPRSASSRICASSLNIPFGNRRRYASNSAGFVLVEIDCQNTSSTSALAVGGCCCAAETAGGAAVAAGDAATTPAGSRSRNVRTPGPPDEAPPPTRRPDTPSPAHLETSASSGSPTASADRTSRPLRQGRSPRLAGPPEPGDAPHGPDQPFLHHRAVAAPHPNRAPRTAPRAALRQSPLPGLGRRAVRLGPPERRAARLLVRRVGRAALERQHHRAPRAALRQRALARRSRRLVVHRPAVLVALALVDRQRTHRVWAAADAAVHTVAQSTSAEPAMIFMGVPPGFGQNLSRPRRPRSSELGGPPAAKLAELTIPHYPTQGGGGQPQAAAGGKRRGLRLSAWFHLRT